MDATVCKGCNLSIIPIRIFGQSKKSKQWWLITKCPRERCGFNIDIEQCGDPDRRPKPKKLETKDALFGGDELSK